MLQKVLLLSGEEHCVFDKKRIYVLSVFLIAIYIFLHAGKEVVIRHITFAELKYNINGFFSFYSLFTGYKRVRSALLISVLLILMSK